MIVLDKHCQRAYEIQACYSKVPSNTSESFSLQCQMNHYSISFLSALLSSPPKQKFSKVLKLTPVTLHPTASETTPNT